MNTPTYINIIRIKIVGTLAVFLAASAVTYILTERCGKLSTLILIASVWLLITFGTIGALVHNFKELRKWKRMLALAISLLLASSFCVPAHAVAVLPRPRPIVPIVNQDGQIEYTVGVVGRDGRIVKQDGTPLRDANGNQLVVIQLEAGKSGIAAIDRNGNLAVPDFTLCEAIGGMIVIGVTVIVGVGIYRCAKKCLYPPTNAPPTNNPDDNDPSPPARHNFASMGADTSGLQWDTTVAANGWSDWTGNPITGSFTCAITNSYLTNADGSTTLMTFQSSPNLINWTNEFLTITGWVSETPAGTNVTTIVYDEYGIPFSTNWSTATNCSTFGVCPVRSNPRMFYKMAP